MALPWGRSSSQGGGASSLPNGEVEVALLPCGGSSPAEALRRMFSFRAPSFDVVDGCAVAPPGAEYEIEVRLSERTPPPNGALRIVRATIDGVEINEQLVLRGGHGSTRFVGWLQDDSGAKRIHFTCLLYTSPSPRDATLSRMPSSA